MDRTSRTLVLVIGVLVVILVATCLIFFVDIITAKKQSDDECMLANGNNGKCVMRENCASLESTTQCGSDKGNVCCLKAFANRKSNNLTMRYFDDDISIANNVLAERVGLKHVASENRILFENFPKCGIYKIEKITGGKEANLFEFPFYALLTYVTGHNKSGFFCGGSLITDRYVLTAAHCIHKTLISVRLGEFDFNKFIDCSDGCIPAVDYNIEKVLIHQNYTQSFDGNDIALLRLSEKVITGPAVRPICLPVKDISKLNLTENRKLTVMGFGVTDTGKSSNVMLKAEVPFVEFNECSRFYESVPQTSRGLNKNSQICAGGGIEDSCLGDSGSPLIHEGEISPEIYKMFQYGIVSFGLSKCGVAPAAYTEVSKFMDWISDNVERD